MATNFYSENQHIRYQQADSCADYSCDVCPWGPLPAPVCIPPDTQSTLSLPAWAFFGWAMSEVKYGVSQRQIPNLSISPSPYTRPPQPTTTLIATTVFSGTTLLTSLPIPSLISVPLYGKSNGDVVTGLNSDKNNCIRTLMTYYNLFNTNSTLAQACTISSLPNSSGFPAPFSTFQNITGCFYSPTTKSWGCFNPFNSSSQSIPCPISDIAEQFTRPLPQCSPPPQQGGSTPSGPAANDAGLIGGIVAVVIVLLVGGVIVLVWNNKRRKRKMAANHTISFASSSSSLRSPLQHQNVSEQILSAHSSSAGLIPVNRRHSKAEVPQITSDKSVQSWKSGPHLSSNLPSKSSPSKKSYPPRNPPFPSLLTSISPSTSPIPSPTKATLPTIPVINQQMRNSSPTKTSFQSDSAFKITILPTTSVIGSYLSGESEQSVLDSWGTFTNQIHTLSSRFVDSIEWNTKPGSIFAMVFGNPGSRSTDLALNSIKHQNSDSLTPEEMQILQRAELHLRRSDVISVSHIISRILQSELFDVDVTKISTKTTGSGGTNDSTILKSLERLVGKGDLFLNANSEVEEVKVWQAFVKSKERWVNVAAIVEKISQEFIKLFDLGGIEIVKDASYEANMKGLVDAVTVLVESAMRVFGRLKAVDPTYSLVMYPKGEIFDETKMDGGINLKRSVVGRMFVVGTYQPGLRKGLGRENIRAKAMVWVEEMEGR
ncbi:hypothetical protein HK098_006169 [Nowakowskiella sp. JEL0407]|nr:hypothetical protein HK098_006169 [Nowakowskiella sp. JEL0407]